MLPAAPTSYFCLIGIRPALGSSVIVLDVHHHDGPDEQWETWAFHLARTSATRAETR